MYFVNPHCRSSPWPSLAAMSLLACFLSIQAMMIEKEIKTPSFDLVLSEPNKCQFFPNPHRVQEANYYIIECQSDVSDVKIKFSGTKTVYDVDMNELPAITAYPTVGQLSSYYVKTCDDLTDSKTCITYQIDVSRIDGKTPLLSYNGLVFTNYFGTLPKFNPSKLSYDVKLYANEPTTIAVKAARGYFVDFETGFLEKGFTEGSATKIYIPKAKEGGTETFNVYVTNPDRSITTTYVINVTTVKSINPRLQSVTVSPGRLDPTFMSHKYSYFLRVPDETFSVTLNVKAVNAQESQCFVQPFGLGKEQVVGKSGITVAQLKGAYKSVKFWENNSELSTTPEPSIVEVPEPISIGASGSVTMKIPPNRHSGIIVIDCIAADDTYRVRYTFTVVSQLGGSTLLKSLEVVNHPFDKTFDPSFSGPYYANINSNENNNDGTQWVNFRVVPYNDKVICKVEGKEVDQTSYFRIRLGEKRQFRISVRTAENAIEEEYFVIVNRPAKWYKDARVLSKFADWVQITSSTIAATRGINFINNAKFLQFLSLTSRLNANPVTYDSYSTTMNKMNLQYDLPSRTYMVDTYGNQTLYALPTVELAKFDVNAQSEMSTALLTRGLSDGEWWKEAAATFNMFEAPVQFVSDKVAKNAKWNDAHQDAPLFEESVSKVLSDWLKQNPEEASAVVSSHPELHAQTGRRILLQQYSESQREIMSRLDVEYKNQQKLLNYCSSIFITCASMVAIGAAYALLWMFYLRDVKEGCLVLRQDFPAILKPARFWTFLFDLALISALQSCCGILFVSADRDAAIRLYGLTVTANKMAWFAALFVIVFPVTFLIVGSFVLFQIRKSLVFSKTLQRFHDSKCEELKASQTFLKWIPLLSTLFTVEITSVAPATRYSTEKSDSSNGPIHFTEDTRTDAPWMEGDPDSVASREAPMDVEAGPRHGGYESLLGNEASRIRYKEEKDVVKVTVDHDSFESRLDTINPSLYNRFPEALVGYSKFKVKNTYDHLINVRAEVQLKHLTSLMNLQSYSFWVPRKNLRQDEVDNWNLLFGKSHQSNLYYWILDRCITAAIIVFLTAWSDPEGISHTIVFGFVSFFAAVVYIPSAIASATSKWYRVMELEVEDKKRKQQLEELEQHRLKVWPFKKSDVEASFKKMRQSKRDSEMFGIYKVWRQCISGPVNEVRNATLWKTRFWLTVRECLLGPVCTELLKFLTLFTILLGNNNVGIYNNVFASITSIVLTIVALICLNTEGLGDWISQLKIMFHELGWLNRRALIKICDYFSQPRLMIRKFTHLVSSLQRQFKGEKGVCYGYPGFSGERVRDYKVDEIVIINNEIGVHLPGVIEHSTKSQHEMKFADSMERERLGMHKTLHMNGPICAHRCMIDRSMPIQLPFKQFYHLGKGTHRSNIVHRLAATIQIVNYNESRAASGQLHNADDDSFLSLYTDPALMPEFGKVRLRHPGHGYVVRYLPNKQMIMIRGPQIIAENDYSIISTTEKQPRNEDDLESVGSASTAEIVGDRTGRASTQAVCQSSGILVISFLSGECPDLFKAIEILSPTGETFEVDPNEIKVEYYEYLVGRTQRREMIIRHRRLVATKAPYDITWTVKTKGRKINATAKAPANGVLFLPWTEEQSPDLHNPIVVRNETKESKLNGSVIDVDPRDTDAHQFLLPPVRYNGAARVAASIVAGFTQLANTVVGRNPAKDILDEPIPCTLVQCTNPLEREYRVEPNFAEALKAIKAKIEQLTGLRKDLDVMERLGYLWSDFMSNSEFISFWESLGVHIVIRGAWINPFTNSNHIYMRENKRRVHDGQLKFRAEIARRIESRIGTLNLLHDRYKAWSKAYSDSDLYSCQVLRDAAEWHSTNTGCGLSPQIRQLQEYKKVYEAAIPDFQYPMKVEDRLISRREKFSAQLRVWREELTAWLFQCEGASPLAEQGGKSCAQATVDDAMRAIEHAIRKTEHAQSGMYHTVLHYVVSSVVVRGRDTNWKPDPLAAHYCMVRLFSGDADDVDKVHWSEEKWTPCYLKLCGNRVSMTFPHEVDAKADVREYYEDDLHSRWSWNQSQAYYIPLECFEKLFLSIDPSIADNPNVSADVRRMHAKLVMKKNTEIHVDDRYVKSTLTGDFCDELLYGNDVHVLKIRLGHTVHNNIYEQFPQDDKFFHGDRCTVLPLTFRFHHSYFNKWQSAIRLAQMNYPRKEMSTTFDGHMKGDGYTESDLSSVPSHVPPPHPPASVSDLGSQSEYDTSSEESVASGTISIDKTDSMSSLSSLPPQPAPSAGEYRGTFRDCRFSGKQGRLYDSTGRLVYEGDWVEGQRWGQGRCVFTDHRGLEWEFEGEFIADEMRQGKLTLIDNKELSRLRGSKNPEDRYAVVAYDGSFSLPSAVRGAVHGQLKKRDYTRASSNCGLRGKPQIRPEFLENLFNTADVIDANEIKDAQLVIDIRRAISACADEDTANATFDWIHNNYGKMKATRFGRQDSNVSTDSAITLDAANALEEYLPHRSKWTRLIDPLMGYQSIFDRLQEGDVFFADGSRFKGSMQNGTPQGRGVLSCPKCPLVYNGYWRKGKPHGYGVLTINDVGAPDRLEYYGNFKDGKRDGKGCQMAKNGQVIIKGEFKDDVLHGKACSIDLADNVLDQFSNVYKRYIGGVEDGLLSDKGKLEWKDKVSYKGSFKDCKRHGQGTMKAKNGKTVVSGSWAADLPDGRLTALILPDGKIYTGDVKQGQRQGMGELYNHGVAYYEGLWMNDLPGGRGTLYTPDGMYEGEFKAGKRHGKGRFEFKANPLPNGKPRVYEGDWKDDKPDGIGRYANELGVVNTYKFKDGELLSSSAKAYKSGICGKVPAMGTKFHIEAAAVTAHDPQYWGLKRRIDAEKIKEIHNLGTGIWEKHENKEFVYTEMNRTPSVHYADELPSPPVKQRSLQSLISSSDVRTAEFLEVKVIEGRDLPNMDIGKKMDPYCKVIVGRNMKKTKPINRAGSNPKWNATLNFPRAGADWVQFEVWDKDTLTRDDFVGAAEYNLTTFLQSGSKTIDVEIPLLRQEKNKDVPAGSIFVAFSISKGGGILLEDEASFSTLKTSRQQPTNPTNGPLCEIKVHSVTDLYNTELLGKMDPYFKFELGQNKTQTDYKKNGGRSCTLDFLVTMPFNKEPVLRFEVWDHDSLSKDDFVGYGSVNLPQFKTGTVEIFRDDKKKGKISAGKVNLSVSII